MIWKVFNTNNVINYQLVILFTTLQTLKAELQLLPPGVKETQTTLTVS